MKKSKQFSNLQKQELETRLVEMRKELMKNRAQVAMGTAPKKGNTIKEIRKNIARVLTEIRRKK